MRAVIQRVLQAHLSVKEETVGSIGKGLLVLVGIRSDDTEEHAEALARKILSLRIFDDENNRMNVSVTDSHGSCLVVSQFTLYGDCRKGHRPDFTNAASSDMARPLYDHFVACLRSLSVTVETGIFAAVMKVTLINDGPVTLIMEV